MSRYSEEFKRDAVAFYENNEELSLNSAEDFFKSISPAFTPG